MIGTPVCGKRVTAECRWYGEHICGATPNHNGKHKCITCERTYEN